MFKNHPKGLLQAALSNMGERFGYYIMNAVLVLFLCSKFGLSDETRGVIYSFGRWYYRRPFTKLQRYHHDGAYHYGIRLCYLVGTYPCYGW